MLVLVFVLAVVAALPAISAAQTSTRDSTNIQACGLPVDPYKSSMSEVKRCGLHTFPRRAVKKLPDGGKEYIYNVEGLKTIYLVPSSGFDPTKASAKRLSEYGFPKRPANRAARKRWTGRVRGLQVATPPPTLAEANARMSIRFYNWSGYTTKSSRHNRYFSVWGRWIEPSFHPSACRHNSLGIWAGLGGWSPSAGAPLAQDGTAHGVGGLANHQGWSEVLPKQRRIIAQPIRATPGKLFQAHVRRIRGGFHFTMHNFHTHKSVNFVVRSRRYNGRTAELIAERPSVNGKFTHLSNFKTLRVKSVLVNGVNRHHRIGHYPHQKAIMTNGSRTMASPADLFNRGRSFHVTQYHCR